MAEHVGYWGGARAEDHPKPTPPPTLDEIISYIRTLNDMYNWNDWIANKLEEKFGG